VLRPVRPTPSITLLTLDYTTVHSPINYQDDENIVLAVTKKSSWSYKHTHMINTEAGDKIAVFNEESLNKTPYEYSHVSGKTANCEHSTVL